MRLTPLDIRKQEFKKGMRGLDADEVYAFLSTVADEYEAVINDNKALRERLLELDDKVQEYRNMEKTLRDTLLTAERVTVEAKENARRESDLIVKEAQIEAEKAVRDVRSTAMKLRQEIQALRQQRDGYLSRMKMLVESHLKFVETAERDFAEEEREILAELNRGVQENDRQRKEPPGQAQNQVQDRVREPVLDRTEKRPEQPGTTDSQAGKINEILDRVIERQTSARDVDPDRPSSEVISRAADAKVDRRSPIKDGEPAQGGTREERPIREAGDDEPPRPAAEPRPAYQNESRDAAQGRRDGHVSDEPNPPLAARTSGRTDEWSLEKLKRDILGGSQPDDEKN